VETIKDFRVLDHNDCGGRRPYIEVIHNSGVSTDSVAGMG